MALPLLPTTLVGSYPQPEWLIDRARLSKMVPRVKMDDLWLVPPAELEAKQDEATLLAIREQEDAGLDIISDGEQRRESYSNRFATALEGVDLDNPGTTINRSGKPIPVPRVKRNPPQEPGGGDGHPLPAQQHKEAGEDDDPRSLHDGEAGAKRFLQD